MRFLKLFLFFCLLPFALFAGDKKPLIVTSINPIYKIAAEIAGSNASTVLLIKPSFFEHENGLKITELRQINSADLIFYIDDNFEKNLAKIVQKNVLKNKSYQLSKINKIKLLHQENNNRKIDYHLWLNPQNAIIIAEFIAQKLVEIDVKNAAKYQENLVSFKTRIIDISNKIKASFSLIKNPKYIFYHDAYQYFEDFFAIKSFGAIASNHEDNLNLSDLKRLESLIKNDDPKCIIGDKFDEKNTAKKLAQNYHLQFFTANALGGEGQGYGEILNEIAEVIKKCQ